MALELPYGYKNLNPEGSSNVDEAYGYYNSVEEACLAVPLAMRKGGRTVGIKDGSGKITEYWWENDNDLSDEGLVVKTAGGGGGDFNPAEHDLDEFKNQSANPYARMDDLPPPFDPTQLENDIQNLENNKVDKEAGKGLSDENFSLEEKEKLANIEEGAQVNVIPDWDADTSNPRRIDNKPTKTSDFINAGATGVSPFAEVKDLPAPGLYTIPQSGTDIGKLDLSNPLGLDATTNVNEVESLSIKSGSVVGGNITFRSRTTIRPTIAGATEQVYLSEPSANFDNTATYTIVVWREANKINWLMRKRS